MNRKAELSVVSKAEIKKVGIPTKKMKLAVAQLRGQKVVNALAILKNTRRNANNPLTDLLKSAVANAIQKDNKITIEELKVSTIFATQGITLKRMMPRAYGRGYMILKKSCQVYVELAK